MNGSICYLFVSSIFCFVGVTPLKRPFEIKNWDIHYTIENLPKANVLKILYPLTQYEHKYATIKESTTFDISILNLKNTNWCIRLKYDLPLSIYWRINCWLLLNLVYRAILESRSIEIVKMLKNIL